MKKPPHFRAAASEKTGGTETLCRPNDERVCEHQSDWRDRHPIVKNETNVTVRLELAAKKVYEGRQQFLLFLLSKRAKDKAIKNRLKTRRRRRGFALNNKRY